MIKNIVTNLKSKSFKKTLCESIIDEFGRNPFLILIACLLSLRTKDSSTLPVCRKLFHIAKTPAEILDIPIHKLESLLFSLGFYKNKANTIRHVSKVLLNTSVPNTSVPNTRVPNTLEGLLSIKGVGRKTANLVLGLAYGIPAICVDIHVHRISNRLGLIKTKTAHETELALQKIVPKKYWIEWNNLLVTLGQNICTPVSPHCSKCPLSTICKKVGVTKSR